MKKGKIIILLGALLLVVASGLGLAIRAWLTDEKETGPKEITVGDVKFIWVGDIVNTGVIVPGQELVTTEFKLANQSNVSTQLRVRIEVTYGQTSTDGFDLVDFVFSGTWTKVGDYYYYNDRSGVISPETEEVLFISSIKLNGGKVGNTFANEKFNFKFTFQAKQSDYVNWDDMGSIDFTTGLNK